MSEHSSKTSHWTERKPNGDKVFCFKVRSHGKTVIYKYTLEEITKIMTDS